MGVYWAISYGTTVFHSAQFAWSLLPSTYPFVCRSRVSQRKKNGRITNECIYKCGFIPPWYVNSHKTASAPKKTNLGNRPRLGNYIFPVSVPYFYRSIVYALDSRFPHAMEISLKTNRPSSMDFSHILRCPHEDACRPCVLLWSCCRPGGCHSILEFLRWQGGKLDV